MKSNCFACKEVKQLTEEHVIPQSLGGRFKAKLYCHECNESFGKDVDAELAKQFGYMATILKIKNERRKPQPFEVVDINKGIRLVFDGKSLRRKDPIVKIESKADKKILKFANITARSKKELDKICNSIQDRYDVHGEIKTFQDTHQGPTDIKYELTIDNTLIRRAVTKIAYSLLCTKVPKDIIFSSAFEEARTYIKNGFGSDLACANFVHTQFMTDYIRPLHKIHIILNRSKKNVVGYVSLFGTYRFTALLADKFMSLFEWPGLDYTFDPMRREEVFGNDRFRAPALTKKDILHPRQSKEFVQNELNKAQKIIEKYVDDYKSLNGELS